MMLIIIQANGYQGGFGLWRVWCYLLPVFRNFGNNMGTSCL